MFVSALLAAVVYLGSLIAAAVYIDFLGAYTVKQTLENDALHRETVVLLGGGPTHVLS